MSLIDHARKINTHKVSGLNEAIEITALDAPGPGGANHEYKIELKDPETGNPKIIHGVSFQNGPIQEAGVNGNSNEALLAVVIDRMKGFQYGRDADGNFDESLRGKFACRENAIALTKLEEAMMWLQKRTRNRTARGVEDTHNI